MSCCGLRVAATGLVQSGALQMSAGRLEFHLRNVPGCGLLRVHQQGMSFGFLEFHLGSAHCKAVFRQRISLWGPNHPPDANAPLRNPGF